MDVVIFVAAWLLVGLIVLFIAFSGGPSHARRAYLTGGRRVFALAIFLVYVGIGIAVPAIVVANRQQALGATSHTRTKEAGRFEDGKLLFTQTCAGCHTLAAANARGVTGPDLDRIGPVTKIRVLNAIKNGGTGQNRMPAGLLEGDNATKVAEYVAAVAGK
jgi:mono/diheme cytochrome c family protein